jgi:hypothetical protein
VWLPLTTARVNPSGPRYRLADLPDAWPGLAPPADATTEPAEIDGGDVPAASPFRLPPPSPIPPRATPNRVARGEH